MYKRELETYLKSKIPKISFLYGESQFLINYYSKKIASLITTNPEDKYKFYFGEYDALSISELLNQSSLFGDSSLVIIRADKKLPKKDIDSFKKAIESNPNNSLIIEFYQSGSKSQFEYMQDCR